MAYPSSPTTRLVVDDIPIPDYAIRGGNFALNPIEQSEQLERDVNGYLEDLSLPLFQQYKLSISVTEIDKPLFDGIWAGKIVNVTLPPRLGVLPYTIQMRVTHWDTDDDEWAAEGNWRLDLEQRGPDTIMT